jgi:hypothetical protein
MSVRIFNAFRLIIVMLISFFAPVRMALRGHPDSHSDAHSDSVRMALCGHPISAISLPDPDHPKYRDSHAGVSLRESQRAPDPKSKNEPPSIFEIMDWFKTMSFTEGKLITNPIVRNLGYEEGKTYFII